MTVGDHPPWSRRGTLLLEIARSALDERLRGTPPGAMLVEQLRDEVWLFEPGAVFVTLRLDGQLRGCIGSVNAVRPLLEDVRSNALAAAHDDPRFPPLTPHELERVGIEVTLLEEPRALAFESEAEALALLRPHVDGVVLHWRSSRSTLLPQVWQSLPDPADFLRCLKLKAGLEPDFWHPELELHVYGARWFGERDEHGAA